MVESKGECYKIVASTIHLKIPLGGQMSLLYEFQFPPHKSLTLECMSSTHHTRDKETITHFSLMPKSWCEITISPPLVVCLYIWQSIVNGCWLNQMTLYISIQKQTFSLVSLISRLSLSSLSFYLLFNSFTTIWYIWLNKNWCIDCIRYKN